MEKFKPAVQNAMNFLAPYFNIDREQLRNFPFPGIRSLSPEDKLRRRISVYDYDINELRFQEKRHTDRIILGHEVGHYFHAHLNKPLWEDGRWYSDGWGVLLVENVAYYAEKIYDKQREIFEHPKINLPDLARKDTPFYLNKFSQEELKSLAEDLGITHIFKRLCIA